MDLHRKQVLILGNALDRLKEPGLLVYSTCSLQREENEDVVAAALTDSREWQACRRLPGIHPGEGFFAAVIPSGKPAND